MFEPVAHIFKFLDFTEHLHIWLSFELDATALNPAVCKIELLQPSIDGVYPRQFPLVSTTHFISAALAKSHTMLRLK